MKQINVGLIGFGTIGVGVVKEILANGELIAQRSGIHFHSVHQTRSDAALLVEEGREKVVSVYMGVTKPHSQALRRLKGFQ